MPAVGRLAAGASSVAADPSLDVLIVPPRGGRVPIDGYKPGLRR